MRLQPCLLIQSDNFSISCPLPLRLSSRCLIMTIQEKNPCKTRSARCMGVGETFHRALGDGDLLASDVPWESLSQTHETGPRSDISLTLSLPFFLPYSLFVFDLKFVSLSDYLFFLPLSSSLSLPLVHDLSICSGLLITQHFHDRCVRPVTYRKDSC